MSRPRLLAIAAVLIIFAEAVWILWPRGSTPTKTDASTVIKSIGQFENLLSRRWHPPPDSGGIPEDITFEHGGKTVTVHLADAQRSLLRMFRPAERTDSTVAEQPPQQPWPGTGFLSWPSRNCVGMETIQAQKCWVIDFKNPAAQSPDDPFLLVRAFIHSEDGSLARMNGYDWSGKLLMNYTVTARKKNKVQPDAVEPYRAEACYYTPGTKKILLKVDYTAKP